MQSSTEIVRRTWGRAKFGNQSLFSFGKSAAPNIYKYMALRL